LKKNESESEKKTKLKSQFNLDSFDNREAAEQRIKHLENLLKQKEE
jgi:hypothetical protein